MVLLRNITCLLSAGIAVGSFLPDPPIDCSVEHIFHGKASPRGGTYFAHYSLPEFDPLTMDAKFGTDPEGKCEHYCRLESCTYMGVRYYNFNPSCYLFTIDPTKILGGLQDAEMKTVEINMSLDVYKVNYPTVDEDPLSDDDDPDAFEKFLNKCAMSSPQREAMSSSPPRKKLRFE
ncbi:hypothetical protein NEOLI_004802 [Neolecta irregularis DAH-3]|uniref:Apple domain-containing protein n=1 Tax=Neolecta irregularis (strain DAH-3) TaxID=1198029 RepID=A0A1U7LPZ5_NEOID|nr:hypothetical protein NEOLI_004802 [Neolecta irregularis DAH-3]|eukprot:OLL24727.1 hypothetical protein NEOLI_004802 [Neolecta irregularis DAH-3]